MALRDLPMARDRGNGRVRQNGRYGAAHIDPRDAYRDVPILRQPTWGNEIAAYFFFGGISSGAFVLGALADLVGGERKRHIARAAHAVSFAALLPCPPLLIDDLGRPARFHHMLRIFKPTSPMNLGAWTLTSHGAFTSVQAFRLLAEAGKLPVIGRLPLLMPRTVLSAGGLPSALILGGYTGVLLGTSSVPVWYTSPLLGGLFMASALSTGSAATSLALALTSRTTAADEPIAPYNLACAATELVLLGGYVATSGDAAKPLMRGKARLMVGAAAVAVAAAAGIEVASLRSTRQRRLLSGLASALTLVGGACLRWGIVLAGQDSAADREGTLRAMSPSAQAPGWGPR